MNNFNNKMSNLSVIKFSLNCKFKNKMNPANMEINADFRIIILNKININNNIRTIKINDNNNI